jgi:fructose-specific phosphotransferase system IIC component
MSLDHAPSAVRDTFRLFVIVGKASLVADGGFLALVFTLARFGPNPDYISAWAEILILVACFLPLGVATAWMFRKLQTFHTRREARAVTIAFGLFTPISMGVSLVLAEITGGYAQVLVGPMIFGLIGAFVGSVLITALLSSLVCALVLRVTRFTFSVEQID